jgi:NADPH-dependent 2,4-dienoyl-CoA reductase/sulfur reductase-like enzyme
LGLETARALRTAGPDVTVIEFFPYLLPRQMDEEGAEVLQSLLEAQGMKVITGATTEAVLGDVCADCIRLKNRRIVEGELVLFSTGIRSEISLAQAAGLETNRGIVVDDELQTSAEDVFAAGDCAEATNVITGRPDYVPLALTANRHGRAIGETVASSELTEVGPIAGTAVVKVFDLEVARTGIIDEELAAEAGFDPVSVTIEAESRAHYYPGGKPIRIQLMADVDSRRVLGAAMVGREGVAKRIDTVVTALHGRMTVDEVEMLDLAYAPPFSPVWDPVLTSAKVLASKVDKAQPVEVSD